MMNEFKLPKAGREKIILLRWDRKMDSTKAEAYVWSGEW